MNKLGIYLHLPFCRRRCLYCDFYSTDRLERREAYVDALCRHLQQAKERFGSLAADSLFFGGGTPSLLSTSEIHRLISEVNDCFPLTGDAEITLETNPATLSPEELPALKASGVNRISLGMQSGVDRELKAIGRLHSAKEALQSAEAVKKAGIPHLSLDLMYALPHQSLDSFRQSLRMAVESGADHLSAYCLTLSEEVPLSHTDFPQADEEEQQQMYLEACAFLESKGLLRYEISNFARPGCESRHNLKYWLRHPTLGFGAAAWSFWDNRRWAIVSDLEQVIRGDYFSLIDEEELLSPEDALSETVMLSLRLRRGLVFRELPSLASPEAVREKEALLRKKLPALLQGGLAEPTENGFCLTHRGAFVSNAILADLI